MGGRPVIELVRSEVLRSSRMDIDDAMHDASLPRIEITSINKGRIFGAVQMPTTWRAIEAPLKCALTISRMETIAFQLVQMSHPTLQP